MNPATCTWRWRSKAGDITSNDATVGGNAPHAWDEGWAFYAGSLEGTATGDKDSGGKLLYNLAGKRCQDFNTCNSAKVAKANLKHLALARNGRDKILAGECHTVAEEFDASGRVGQIGILQHALDQGDGHLVNDGVKLLSDSVAFTGKDLVAAIPG